MGILDWLRPLLGAAPAGTEPDGFPLPDDHPYAAEHRMLSVVMREVSPRTVFQGFELKVTEAGRQLLALDADAQRRLVLSAVERQVWMMASRGSHQLLNASWFVRMVPSEVLKALLRRALPLTAEDLVEVLDALRTVPRSHDIIYLPLRSLLSQVERHGSGAAMPAPLRAAVSAFRAHLLASAYDSAGRRQVLARIDELLAEPDADGPRVIFTGGERWIELVAAEIDSVPPDRRRPWLELAAHLSAAGSATPSARWRKEARRLRDAIGGEAVRESAHAWVAAAWEPTPTPVDPRNGDFLRGVVWLMAEDGGDDEARALGDLGLAMARKIPNVGMRSTKVLNACVTSLGAMAGRDALAQLSRLRAKIKAPQAQALIARTLEEAARRQGMPLADLEELVVPTFGMEDVGRRRERLGDFEAHLRIAGTDAVELVWVRPDDREQKTVPADVRRDHAEELAELKRTAQEMAKMLPAQRDRLEQLFLTERVLPYAQWRERYLDHPFLGPLARRLIWHVTGPNGRAGPVAWLDGRLVDAEDRRAEWVGEGADVRLWHPLGFDVETVRAWRGWLERHGVSQPFKQAHREIYILTDAELRTATYSNRFAAHIVRQHQFAALCRARGWRYHLQGWFDPQSTPTLELSRLGLRAELWVEACIGDDQAQSESGIALYAATDQVRFVNSAGEAIPLAEVPALVFSEVMRDVDLFVGVASVGGDPTWMDRGQRPEWNDYWQSYAFGDLSATAQTRREVLERLLPRLKIAPRCAIDGKFLLVRGDLRTYKIHLGSGNILMEPNDQYLCIVPDRGAGARQTGNVWLPFEGDGTMTVILSKAVLLAADAKITDETILRQIRRR